MKDVIHYFAPTKAVAASLGAMARQAFSDTFAHLYDPAPFVRFLEEAYGPGGTMERGLSDPAILWQVAAVGDQQHAEVVDGARGLPQRGAEDLARASAVGVATIRRAELATGQTSMTAPNDMAVRRALEAAW